MGRHVHISACYRVLYCLEAEDVGVAMCRYRTPERLIPVCLVSLDVLLPCAVSPLGFVSYHVYYCVPTDEVSVGRCCTVDNIA